MEAEGGEGGPRLLSRRTMDIVVALLLLAAAAVVIADSMRLGIGWRETEGPTAGYFPFFIGVILAVSSAVNLLRALLIEKGGAAQSFVTVPAFLRVLAVLIPLAIYVGAVAFAGIYVASTVFIALFMTFFAKYPPRHARSRRIATIALFFLRGLAIGVAIAIAFFLMFEVWFLVPLPKGPLEAWLGF
jgi:hypothetical protein